MDVIFGIEEIQAAAENFWQQCGQRKVFAFHGQMGAGKTTFIRALCDAKGVEDAVGSPTFSIINEYRTAAGEKIFHMDLYRLKDEEEAVNAGVEDCFNSRALCLVEWPEKAPGIFPEETVHCRLEIAPNNKRKLKINL
ncbi:MAG: tRNA (adenosine(37)-N6)-threonylcarbamoyltransferase complex ATPase subunit type 1 TsaE [Ferruginibacter sp.]